MTNVFRPEKWADFLGQEYIINSLKVYTQAAKTQSTCLDNVLISGPSGMGKTSLAYLIAKVMKVRLHLINGPNLTKPSDLISILTAIKQHEVLFIDEIHSVNKEILEVLYPVLEDNKLSIVIGKEYNSKIINVKLPKFTIIIATTEVHKLPFPFINRFPIYFQLADYSEIDLIQIVQHTADRLRIAIPPDAQALIANYARQTPRIIINLIKRINDYVLTQQIADFSLANVKYVFSQMRLLKYGLYEKDFEYLCKLREFKYLGVEHMSQMINLPPAVIINNIEPTLMKQHLIIRTIRGRSLTSKGVEYLQSNNFTKNIKIS